MDHEFWVWFVKANHESNIKLVKDLHSNAIWILAFFAFDAVIAFFGGVFKGIKNSWNKG